ncbi:MAG: hypothetical protein KA715_10025 [Xanthomonadaceae bacterium]|nr:hypothetical protein [Xanthomonadaceae bacterium]
MKPFKITTERMLNILAHSQMEEREIGSRCGGYGECGGDRVIIAHELQKAYFNPPTNAERDQLTPDQLKQGMRLGCQCYPNVSGIEITLHLP